MILQNWCIVQLDNIRYISVLVCFTAFLVNDIYALISWKRIEKKQLAYDSKHKDPMPMIHSGSKRIHGAYVLAESTVILKCVCKRDTCYVIGGISADESPEHDPFDVADPGKEQCPLF